MVGGEPARGVILAEEGRRVVKRQVGQCRPTFCIVADWASISAFNGLAQLIANGYAFVAHAWWTGHDRTHPCRIVHPNESALTTNRTSREKARTVNSSARRSADVPRSDAEEPSPMSMKNRRGNREAKKPKQNKPKVAVSASPYAAVSSNPAKAAAAKRK